MGLLVKALHSEIEWWAEISGSASFQPRLAGETRVENHF
ncbi:hypothetical protein LINPERHAP1_LOCUS23677 [Linum perenne]